MHRLVTILADIDRQGERDLQGERLARSEAMHAAAIVEANEAGIVLTHSRGMYAISDERHLVQFYAVSNEVLRFLIGERRCDRLQIPAEIDVYDCLQLFLRGEFLK